MNIKMLIISFITYIVGITVLNASSKATVGFVISERCEKGAQKYLLQWQDDVNISYSVIDNKLGGFYTYFTKYVTLTSSKHNKKLLTSLKINQTILNLFKKVPKRWGVYF